MAEIRRLQSLNARDIPQDVSGLDEIRKILGIDALLKSLGERTIDEKSFKGFIEEITALFALNEFRKSIGIDSPRPRLHMAITGPDEERNATFGLKAAEIYCDLGIIPEGPLVRVSADEIMRGADPNAPKIHYFLEEAKGGVLFIERVRHYEGDAAMTTVEKLLSILEIPNPDTLVIITGLPDNMGAFFETNPGLFSRFPQHLNLARQVPVQPV